VCGLSGPSVGCVERGTSVASQGAGLNLVHKIENDDLQKVLNRMPWPLDPTTMHVCVWKGGAVNVCEHSLQGIKPILQPHQFRADWMAISSCRLPVNASLKLVVDDAAAVNPVCTYLAN
jgi:hypothetical protein